jgi:hypothetical protein
LEVVGAIALVVPRAIYYGAGLLVVIMTCVLIAHLTILGASKAAPAIVLMPITGIIA